MASISDNGAAADKFLLSMRHINIGWQFLTRTVNLSQTRHKVGRFGLGLNGFMLSEQKQKKKKRKNYYSATTPHESFPLEVAIVTGTDDPST